MRALDGRSTLRAVASRTRIKVVRAIAWLWLVGGALSAVIGVVLLFRFERTGIGARAPLANVWAWSELVGGIALTILGYWILRRMRTTREVERPDRRGPL